MILSGKELSNKLRANIADKVKEIKQRYGRVPHLVVVMVGNDPASQSYVNAKSKVCDEVGIQHTTVYFHKDVSEIELLKKIQELNYMDSVDGILVQLPLPAHINPHSVMDAIAWEKDVDGFHSFNINSLYTGSTLTYDLKPCTPSGIIKLLKYANVQLEGANVAVIGRSNIVGLPVAKMLLDENATVTVCHSKTKNLAKITSEADVLIVAIGKPKFVTADMIKPGAVVIDVGVNRVDGKLVGDVDFDNIINKVSAITPVPGGVGPMTITCLMENTIKCFLK